MRSLFAVGCDRSAVGAFWVGGPGVTAVRFAHRPDPRLSSVTASRSTRLGHRPRPRRGRHNSRGSRAASPRPRSGRCNSRGSRAASATSRGATRGTAHPSVTTAERSHPALVKHTRVVSICPQCARFSPLGATAPRPGRFGWADRGSRAASPRPRSGRCNSRGSRAASATSRGATRGTARPNATTAERSHPALVKHTRVVSICLQCARFSPLGATAVGAIWVGGPGVTAVRFAHRPDPRLSSVTASRSTRLGHRPQPQSALSPVRCPASFAVDTSRASVASAEFISVLCTDRAG